MDRAQSRLRPSPDCCPDRICVDPLRLPRAAKLLLPTLMWSCILRAACTIFRVAARKTSPRVAAIQLSGRLIGCRWPRHCTLFCAQFAAFPPRFFVYRLRRYVPTWAGSISGCASALATVTGTARRAVSLPKHLRFRDVAQQAARLSPSLITVAASHRGRRFGAVVEGAVSPHRHVSARPDDSHHAGTPVSSSATGRCDSRYRRPNSAASSNAGAAVNTP